MLVEGLRVAPQERGKGVARVLLRFCSQLVKSKYPDVKVSRLTRDDKLGPKDFQKYRLISKQVRVSAQASNNNDRTVIDHNTTSDSITSMEPNLFVNLSNTFLYIIRSLLSNRPWVSKCSIDCHIPNQAEM